MKKKKQVLTIKDMTLIGMMVAVIEVCKVALAWAPNIELTSFLLIMFTLFFGRKIVLVVPVFILIEGAMYGVHMWWIMYLYAWPTLAIVALLLKKKNWGQWEYSMLSGVFGLLFGFLCAIPYVFTSGIHGAVTWWIGGIPWDLVHGVANFAIMMVLYQPINRVMAKMENL